MDNYHITAKGDEWRFKKVGAERAIKVADTKETAIKDMQKFMQNHEGSVKIHKKNGEIQEERTYPRSIDPSKSKG